jgi:S1-C subfamily serine protease
VIKDQPGKDADLLYWLDSIQGNGGALLVGIVHYSNQIASLVYNYSGDEGHVISFDIPPQTTSGASVIGLAPHQQVKVTLPWLTPVDSRSQAARMYYFMVKRSTPSYSGYQVVYNDQPYVGVGLSPVPGSTEGVVGYVDPESPAASTLQVGDVLTGVAGSSLSALAAKDLNGPIVIEEVALLHPGDKVSLDVIRDGTPMTVEITLAQQNPNGLGIPQSVSPGGTTGYLSGL